MKKQNKLTPREAELDKVFGGKLSTKVLRYMRKNPRQVGRNYTNEKSLFGSYTSSVPANVRTSINRREDTIMTNWSGLYDRSQLKTYLKG